MLIHCEKACPFCYGLRGGVVSASDLGHDDVVETHATQWTLGRTNYQKTHTHKEFF